MHFGEKIIHLEDTTSTNHYIQQLLKEKKISSGTFVKTDYQKNGKGHFGSVWESEKGKNLLFSFVLFPEFLDVGRSFYLSKVVSLAICKTIRAYVKNTFIKWPNDIMCNDKKICGILIENSLILSKISTTIIGIGLNINQEKFIGNFEATSLLIETQKHYKLDHVFQELTAKINKEFQMLFNSKFNDIDMAYLSMLYNYDKWRRYKDKTGEFEAMIMGIGENGELILKKKYGMVQYYQFKEVTLLNDRR